MEAAVVVLDALTEALDKPPCDGYARFQAHLLKRHYACERLEQIHESRRPHTSQRTRGGTQHRFRFGETLERPGIHIQSEDLAQHALERGKPTGGRVTGSNGQLKIRCVDRSPIVHFDQYALLPRRQHTQIAIPIPDIHTIAWAPLQHPHSRFEMKRRTAAEGRLHFIYRGSGSGHHRLRSYRNNSMS